MSLYEFILRRGKKYSSGKWGDTLLTLTAGGVTGKRTSLKDIVFFKCNWSSCIYLASIRNGYLDGGITD